MIQNGIVVSVKEGMAEVGIERSEACAKCRACSVGRKEQVIIVIPNRADAKPGDVVGVELHGEKVVKASALAYIFPLIAFLLGIWVAPEIYPEGAALPKDIFSCLIALGLMAVAFTIIRLTEKKRATSGEFAPRMSGVISSAKDAHYNEKQMNKNDESLEKGE